MAAQGKNPASGPADVAEKQLKNSGGTDHLHAVRVLRPAHCVTDSGRARGPRGGAESLGEALENIGANTAHSLQHFRGVSVQMAFQNLEYAAGMAQRQVTLVFRFISRATTPVFAVTAPVR